MYYGSNTIQLAFEDGWDEPAAIRRALRCLGPRGVAFAKSLQAQVGVAVPPLGVPTLTIELRATTSPRTGRVVVTKGATEAWFFEAAPGPDMDPAHPGTPGILTRGEVLAHSTTTFKAWAARVDEILDRHCEKVGIGGNDDFDEDDLDEDDLDDVEDDLDEDEDDFGDAEDDLDFRF